MPSEISKIIKAYQRSLNVTRGRYESLYSERGHNALDFYKQYAYRFVRNYSSTFRDIASRRRLHREVRRALGTDVIDFVAIDGSCPEGY